MKLIITILAALILAGCATTKDVEMAQAHYAAQAAAAERPMVRIKAQEGRDVVITGMDEMVVYAPSGPVQGYRQQHHPVWSILGQTLQVAAPIYLGGQAAIGLADVVGKRVGDVARDVTVVEQPAPVQQPAPIIVDQPAPIVVEQPAPIFAPDPIIVPPPPYNDPIIIQPPEPIFAPEPIIIQPQPSGNGSQ